MPARAYRYSQRARTGSVLGGGARHRRHAGVAVEPFQQRFNIAEVTTAYGMTEIPGARGRLPGQPLVPGSCGRPRPNFEVRLVDEHDIEVAVGEVGQAIVRTSQPWMISPGYVVNAEATAAAWRNGWFHTGDLLRRDTAGNFFFVDRLKDALRRRGKTSPPTRSSKN